VNNDNNDNRIEKTKNHNRIQKDKTMTLEKGHHKNNKGIIISSTN
jgi:hypothetical protein